MNVLGVIFDCKLNWNSHGASAINKAKTSLFALRLLRKYFSPNEMRTLLDSNFNSTLYYNAVIWLTPELSTVAKQALLSISANALRNCMMLNCSEISFERIHSICEKSTPKQIMCYQISLKLHTLINEINENCTFELVQIVCTRMRHFWETSYMS